MILSSRSTILVVATVEIFVITSRSEGGISLLRPRLRRQAFRKRLPLQQTIPIVGRDVALRGKNDDDLRPPFLAAFVNWPGRSRARERRGGDVARIFDLRCATTRVRRRSHKTRRRENIEQLFPPRPAEIVRYPSATRRLFHGDRLA